MNFWNQDIETLELSKLKELQLKNLKRIITYVYTKNRMYNKKLNSYRKKLVRTAINFNKQRKAEMIGKSYYVILAEQYLPNDSHVIGYIIKGGPKVLVKNAFKYLGKTGLIKIIHVISDKLIEGEIVKIL